MSAIDETNDLTEWDILFIYNKQNVKDILKKKGTFVCKRKAKGYFLFTYGFIYDNSFLDEFQFVSFFFFFFEKFLKENLLCDVRKTELGELLNVI